MSLCDFCGEKEGTKKIANPNLDMTAEINWSKKENWWMVCSPCSKAIMYWKLDSPPYMLEDDELIEALENSYTAIINLKELSRGTRK